jgi:CRISPR/Cas system-associated protein Cas10 (large subunit of type III CRISPR-Cas system)
MTETKLFFESVTAEKRGWGSAMYRWVRGLTKEERQAVRAGDTVWFRINPWHYTQSGYKIVTVNRLDHKKFDTREPTSIELTAIKAQIRYAI